MMMWEVLRSYCQKIGKNFEINHLEKNFLLFQVGSYCDTFDRKFYSRTSTNAQQMKPSSFQQIWHILVQDSVLYREEKAFLLDLRCQFSLLLLVSGIRCTDLVRCSAPD